jgi:hypothetical protein
MLTERYSGLSFKFFLHFSMRFFTLESLRRTIIWRGGKARPYINEDLTKIRNGIAYRARQLKKLKLVTDTWTIDGKIFVKVRDRVVLVNNVAIHMITLEWR